MASYRPIQCCARGRFSDARPVPQRAVVLLVEDDPDDVVIIREAFDQSLTPIQLYVAAMASRR